MLSLKERRDALVELNRIATDAAAVVMQGYRQRSKRVDYKGEVDLVTDYDRASEALIRERVAKSFPGVDVVAEEDGGETHGDRPVLYVDPLDGTTNFAHGHPFFAVSIGLLTEPVVECGVVVAPALGWSYSAARECGATRNGEVCKVSTTKVLDRSLLATGFPYDRRTSPENNFRAFVELKRRAQGIRRCGAASLDLCLVGEGVYDGYWEIKLRTWDLAAGTLVVLEAGGTCSSVDGGIPDVRKGEMVASNGVIHAELLGALRASAAHPNI